MKRFEGALQIFAVQKAYRKMILLYYMEVEPYNLLCDHLDPAEPETISYEEMVSVLEKFLDLEPFETIEL